MYTAVIYGKLSWYTSAHEAWMQSATHYVIVPIISYKQSQKHWMRWPCLYGWYQNPAMPQGFSLQAVPFECDPDFSLSGKQRSDNLVWYNAAGIYC